MKGLRLSIVVVISLLLPPLLAVWLTGTDISPYLNFPFRTPAAQHNYFNWFVWSLMVGFVFIVVLPFVVHALSFKIKPESISGKCSFPGWGIIAIIFLVGFWILAWNRFAWFSPLQIYTFTPLWLCYIVIINAITCCRVGHCLLSRHPTYLFALLILSSFFWWYYEYLNGFIRNWHYIGVEHLAHSEYVFHASIAFATVLPAVISTIELLNTLPRLNQSFTSFRPLLVPNPKLWALASWPGGCVVLLLSAFYPEQLFLFVWVAPLLIIVGIRYVLGYKTLFSSLAYGDWRPVTLPAIAALICGFFWELWNSQSRAHWDYNVPYVDHFLLFEMPVIGYAGYLPFGMVCLALAELLQDTDKLFTDK